MNNSIPKYFFIVLVYLGTLNNCISQSIPVTHLVNVHNASQHFLDSISTHLEKGMLVFSVGNKSLYCYDGTKWVTYSLDFDPTNELVDHENSLYLNHILRISDISRHEVRLSDSRFEIGDIKQSVLSEDHHGWFKMDGRTLAGNFTDTEIEAAQKLGFATALPDATNLYYQTNTTPLGTIQNIDNAVTLSKGVLPKIRLTGSGTPRTQSKVITIPYRQGLGNSRFNPNTGNSAPLWKADKDLNIKVVFPNQTMRFSLGGSNVPIDVTPHTFSMNSFIYLGR